MGKRRQCKKIIACAGMCRHGDNLFCVSSAGKSCQFLHAPCDKSTTAEKRVQLAREWLEAHPKKKKTNDDAMDAAGYCIKMLTAEDVERDRVLLSLPKGERFYLVGNRHIFMKVTEV